MDANDVMKNSLKEDLMNIKSKLAKNFNNKNQSAKYFDSDPILPKRRIITKNTEKMNESLSSTYYTEKLCYGTILEVYRIGNSDKWALILEDKDMESVQVPVTIIEAGMMTPKFLKGDIAIIHPDGEIDVMAKDVMRKFESTPQYSITEVEFKEYEMMKDIFKKIGLLSKEK